MALQQQQQLAGKRRIGSDKDEIEIFAPLPMAKHCATTPQSINDCLPPEVLLRIICYALEPNDRTLPVLRRVCRAWREHASTREALAVSVDMCSRPLSTHTAIGVVLRYRKHQAFASDAIRAVLVYHCERLHHPLSFPYWTSGTFIDMTNGDRSTVHAMLTAVSPVRRYLATYTSGLSDEHVTLNAGYSHEALFDALSSDVLFASTMLSYYRSAGCVDNIHMFMCCVYQHLESVMMRCVCSAVARHECTDSSQVRAHTLYKRVTKMLRDMIYETTCAPGTEFLHTGADKEHIYRYDCALAVELLEDTRTCVQNSTRLAFFIQQVMEGTRSSNASLRVLDYLFRTLRVVAPAFGVLDAVDVIALMYRARETHRTCAPYIELLYRYQLLDAERDEHELFDTVTTLEDMAAMRFLIDTFYPRIRPPQWATLPPLVPLDAGAAAAAETFNASANYATPDIITIAGRGTFVYVHDDNTYPLRWSGNGAFVGDFGLRVMGLHEHYRRLNIRWGCAQRSHGDKSTAPAIKTSE